MYYPFSILEQSDSVSSETIIYNLLLVKWSFKIIIDCYKTDI